MITLKNTYRNYFRDRTIFKQTFTIYENFSDGGMTLTFNDGTMSEFVPL